MITFSTGLPDMQSLLLVEGYGYAQFHSFAENGDIQINLGHRRIMTVPSETRWRYTR